mmetsp:Transcript_17165/g.42739  ORF Transcript_17165/g.42739 Transcript_17165/m.42739 type:complete len:259 (+) Transcript_17165:1106-1882(+)
MRARLPARQVREAIRLCAGAASRRECACCGRRGDVWLLLRVPARARAARVLLRIPLWRFGKHRCRRRDGEHHAGGARVPRCWPRDLAGGHAHQAHRLRGHVHVPVASALRTSVRPPATAVVLPAAQPRAQRRGAPQMGRARGGRRRSLCAPGPRSPLPPQPEHRSICRDWRAARPQEGALEPGALPLDDDQNEGARLGCCKRQGDGRIRAPDARRRAHSALGRRLGQKKVARAKGRTDGGDRAPRGRERARSCAHSGR